MRSGMCGKNGEFTQALLDSKRNVPEGVTDYSGRVSLKRFNIYRNNVIVSLMEAMEAAYPSLKVIMGEENFARVSRNYVVRHPPSTPVMMEFGSEFPRELCERVLS